MVAVDWGAEVSELVNPKMDSGRHPWTSARRWDGAWGPDWLTETRGMAFQNCLNLDVLHVSVINVARPCAGDAVLWPSAAGGTLPSVCPFLGVFLGLGRKSYLATRCVTENWHGRQTWQEKGP